MIGDRFSVHFLVFRYAFVLLLALGLWFCSRPRSRSPAAGLGLLALLGGAIWLYTWMPLERSYGLAPGSPAAFELALVSAGAAGNDPGESWLSGRRNPRPLWTLLWRGAGSPETARSVYAASAPVLLALLFFLIYVALAPRPGDRDRSWEAISCAFAAVFASSVPLDAFRPFGLFARSFFVAPHLLFALALAAGAFAALGRAGVAGKLLAGVVLGAAAWVDVSVFCWALLSLLAIDLLRSVRDRRVRLRAAWPAGLIAGLAGSPQLLALLREELLMRGPAPEAAQEYRTAFRDLFAVATDMEWVFFLGVAAAPFLWRRGRKSDFGLLALVPAAYLVWAIAAAGFFRGRLLLEPDAAFHLVRLSFALLAGAGAYRLARGALDRLGRLAPAGRPQEPLAFGLLVLFLVPNTALFLWNPLRVDPLYYPSLTPVDAAVARLERSLLEHTTGEAVVLSGADTSEWIAALTGRRVVNGIRVLPREDRRSLGRDLRALFLSESPEKMREALASLGVEFLVWDLSLRTQFWELEPGWLEESGLFVKVDEIGDRYAVYRAR